MQLLHPVCLVLAALGLLILLRDVRLMREDPALAALAAGFFLSAMSFVVSLNAVWDALDALRPNVGVLVAHGCVVGLVVSQLVVLAYWGDPDNPARARRRSYGCIATGLVVVAGLAALYSALPRAAVQPAAFTAYELHHDAAVCRAYLLVYITTYALGEGTLAWFCWTKATRQHKKWITRGLRTVAVGSALTLGYSAIRYADIAGMPAPGLEPVAWTFADVGSAVVITGWFIPTIAYQAVPRAQEWLAACNQYRQLGPMWETMHQALPGIVLVPTRSKIGALVRALRIRWYLYRRMVEIRDVQLMLRPYVSVTVRREAEQRHRAAGLSGAQLAAAVTADQIRAALAAHAQGIPADEPAGYANEDLVAADGPVHADDDLHTLLEIAHRFASTAPATATR